MDARPRYRRSAHGFALIEVLLVLVIATTIMVISYKNFAAARLKAARVQVTEVAKQVFLFKLDTDDCPTDLDALMTQRYLTPAHVKDPWGTSVDVRCPGEHHEVDVVSAGPDERPVDAR